MKKLLLSTIFIALFALSSFAQTDAGKVEITQETANKCAQCFDETKAKDEQIKVLKEAVDNLKLELMRVTAENAKNTGLGIAKDAELQFSRSVIQICAAKSKSKQFGLINFKLGGND